MLPQRHRLRRRAAVQRVRQQGRAWRHPLAVLLVAPAVAPPEMNGRPPLRFAFSASRAVGNAVQRNRAKRMLREAVRQELPALEQGWDCLLVARRGAAEASYEDVCAAVNGLLRRANLFVAADHPVV